METGGIIFMALGWGMAIGLLVFCLIKIMKAGGASFNED
jgi:hypothetical protein